MDLKHHPAPKYIAGKSYTKSGVNWLAFFADLMGQGQRQLSQMDGIKETWLFTSKEVNNIYMNGYRLANTNGLGRIEVMRRIIMHGSERCFHVYVTVNEPRKQQSTSIMEVQQ